MRKYAAMLIGFAVVAIGLLLLSRRYVIDQSEYYPPAYLIFVAASGVFLIRTRLKDLYREGKLHGIYLTIAERGLAPGLVQHYISRRRPARGPLLRLSILAGIIFLFVWVLAANDLLFEQNLSLVEKFDWMAQGDHEEVAPIRRLLVQTEGRGTEERLQLMLKVTRDLTGAGAKVVVLELPQTVSRPYYRDLVSKIQSAGGVVFAVQTGSYVEKPISWHTRQFYGPWLAPDTAVRSWGLLTGEFGELLRTHRSVYFVPDGYVHYRQGETDTIPDVTIEILRKWRNYPLTVKPLHAGREVLFGDYRIPVSPAGLAICPYRFGPGFGFLPLMAVDDWKKGVFEYRWDVHGEERSAEDMKEFAQQIRDMIVIVSWADPVEKNLSVFITGMYPMSLILRDALLGKFAAVRDDVHIPATITVLIAALLLILRTRARVSITLLVLLAALLVFGSGWLFWNRLILVEVIYPLVGLVLCILLLPLAKISVEIQEEGA